MTNMVFATKAATIRDKHLQDHLDELSQEEVQALNVFKASLAWAGKWARENGFSSIRLNGKAGGAPIDDPEVQQLIG
jgi:hypothetical protein